MAPNQPALGVFRLQLNHVQGNGKDLPPDGQDLAEEPDRLLKAVHLRHGRNEQVAEAVALQARSPGKTVLKQALHYRFRIGHGQKAGTYIPGRKHAQLPAQAAGAPPVVGDRDHGGKVAGILLQVAQQGREPGPAADGHQPGTAGQVAPGKEFLDQRPLVAGLEHLPHRLAGPVQPHQDQEEAQKQEQEVKGGMAQFGQERVDGLAGIVDYFRAYKQGEGQHHQAQPQHGQDEPAFDL